MLLAVIQYGSAYPLDICPRGAYAVAHAADAIAHTVQQLVRFGHMESFEASRLRSLILGHPYDLFDLYRKSRNFRPTRSGRLFNS